MHRKVTDTRKFALVTGGSSGMGLEYARQLAAEGFDLLLVSIQPDELARAKDSLEKDYGINVITRFQDLASAGAADDLLAFCKAGNIIPDVLVCNAGMFFFKELTPELLGRAEAMVNLHVLTNTKLAILFGDEMKKRGSGRIILMSSMAAKLPTPGIAIYSATKAYLRSFGKSLWFEMRPYGVDVTTVCPAAIATPLYKLKPSLMNIGVKLGVIKTPEWLVKRALKASERGRRVISPSFMNIYLPPLIRLLPCPIENKLWIKFRHSTRSSG